MIRARLRFAMRFLPRALRVLRTEGPRVLLQKAKRRLGTTQLRVRRPPQLIEMTPPFEPMVLAAPAHPRVSVIVPVFNSYRYTYHCLAALQRHRGTVAMQVIVVDDGSSDETRPALSRFEGLVLVENPVNRGFVHSCNRGAEVASGEYLVFLNNDTQVQPGWLDPLLETFETQPDAGLVGSRLIYPDGRLQEAGGIVFADGSAWNYGQLDDPSKPQYSYLREPDYVSGAALMVRRDLFRRLGGFDEHYAPAYYEDTDLAFRARAAGYRVYYQPLSIVVHFEGVSAGIDERASTGMKRFQPINQKKLLERWREVLLSHGSRGVDLERQKERRVRRRAFLVDVYMLTPDKESGSLRMVNLIAILRELGFKVTFAALSLEAPEPYAGNLQKTGVEVLYRPYVKSIERHLKSCGGTYDLVILSRADSAAKELAAARRWCRNARIVYDTVDLHFLREMRLADLTGDKVTRALALRRRREELELIAQADTTLVVSTVERDLLEREAPGADVRVVSNIHRVFGRRRSFEQRQDIFFIGAFAHPPNADAVCWFCREAFPLVLEDSPDIRFSVIGADPPPQVLELASSQVQVLGHVPDVGPYFDGCRMSVAPLRYGAGVKGKVNQSLAHGLPVVATSQAAEGMYLVDGESVLLADAPRTFADAILRLYHDPALWTRLSDGGLAVMEAHFGFDAARRAMIDLVGP